MIARLPIPLLLILIAACGTVQVVARTPEGAPLLVRSGQPTAHTLERLHAQYGIRTVVNLRGENPDANWWQVESKGVRGIGARWVQFPVDGRGALTRETAESFMDLIEEPSSWPVLIHCESGIHRTGALVALFRMQYEGWSPEDAITELRRNGFRLGGRDRTALEESLREYRRDPSRELP